MDWKFWIIDIGIPVATFIMGIFTGKTIEKRSSAKFKGDNNTIIQNSNYTSR